MLLRRVPRPSLPLIAGWQIGHFEVSRTSTVIKPKVKDAEEIYLIPGNIFDGSGKFIASVSLENIGRPTFYTGIHSKFQIFYILPNEGSGFWAMP